MSCSANSTSSKPHSECSNNECIGDQEENVLKCRKCDRNVHYECSQLPAYQIQTFIKYKTIRSNYICQNCIQPELWVKELVKKSSETNNKDSDDLGKSVASQTETNSKDLNDLQKKVRDQANLIKQYKEKEALLQKELVEKDANNKTLKKQLQNNPGYHTLEFVEEKMEMKLDSFKESILTAIKKSADNTETKISQSVTNYASAAKVNSTTLPTGDIKQAVKVIRQAEKDEERRKEIRSKNLIVHGVPEIHNGEKFAEDLRKDIHADVQVKQIFRIGKPTEDKIRPIKIVLNSEDDKFKFFGNLSGLRGNEKYKGISVTEDLSKDERAAFKELSNQAKERNLKEKDNPDCIWRVRGSTKNGYRLKKVQRSNKQ